MPRTDAERRTRQVYRHSRVVRVLELIQGKARWGVKDLASQLECSERTIFRDLAVLEMAGVPWYFDDEHQCYRIREGVSFPVTSLTDEELLGQAVATAITSAPGLNVSAGAKPTTRKLLASSSAESAKLLQDAMAVVQALGLKIADHSQSHEIIGTVQRALIAGKQVEGRYQSPYQAKPVKLALNPIRLCFIMQAWYLIGKPNDGEDIKSYRVARFKALRMTETEALVPPDFNINAFLGNAWGVYRGEPTFDVEVLFTPDAAPLVVETVWHHSQKVKKQKDGSVILSFRVDGLSEIVHWVLGWSGRAKVIEPRELRALVVEHLRSGLKLNEEN